MFIDMSAFLVQALHLKAFLPGTLAEHSSLSPHKRVLASGESLDGIFLSIFLVLAPPPSLADQDSGGRKRQTHI